MKSFDELLDDCYLMGNTCFSWLERMFLDPEVLPGSLPLCLAVSVEGLLTTTLGFTLMESNYSRQRTLANLIKLLHLAMLKGRRDPTFVRPKANTRKYLTLQIKDLMQGLKRDSCK